MGGTPVLGGGTRHQGKKTGSGISPWKGPGTGVIPLPIWTDRLIPEKTLPSRHTTYADGNNGIISGLFLVKRVAGSRAQSRSQSHYFELSIL